MSPPRGWVKCGACSETFNGRGAQIILSFKEITASTVRIARSRSTAEVAATFVGALARLTEMAVTLGTGRQGGLDTFWQSSHAGEQAEVKEPTVLELDPLVLSALELAHRTGGPVDTEAPQADARLSPTRSASVPGALSCRSFKGASDRCGVVCLLGRRPPDLDEIVEALTQHLVARLDALAKREELEHSVSQWTALVETTPAAIVLVEPDGTVTYVNATARACSEGIHKGASISRFGQTHQTPLRLVVEQVFETGEGAELELTTETVEGGERLLAIHLGPVRFSTDGAVSRVAVVGLDITTRSKLETRLQEAHKMEAIATLAGGVAHDFNNLLTVISGCTELALLEIEDSVAATECLEQVAQATARAVDLTAHLLAFGRRQVLQPELIDPARFVREVLGMLRRVVAEHIAVDCELADNTPPIRVDPNKMEQALIHLVANAQDAMPDGGALRLRVANVVSAGTAEVMIAIEDTGVGMNAAVRGRIFDPFYTTKPAGEGTGMGLPMVLGVVEQSGGRITVESAVGQGTTVRLFLPAVSAALPKAPTPADAPQSTLGFGSGETVLVVEDEAPVRKVSARMLALAGYRVLVADSGAEAMRVAGAEGHIDLLFTDVVMPGQNGREVAEGLRAVFPDLKVLFASGYTDDHLVRHGVGDGTRNFLQKPYTREQLTMKVRAVLDQ